jgi:hypothetical protein
MSHTLGTYDLYFTQNMYGEASHITDKMHSVLLDYQAKDLERITTNFKKDTASRKTKDYLTTKPEKLQNLWKICVSNVIGFSHRNSFGAHLIVYPKSEYIKFVIFCLLKNLYSNSN